MAAPWAHPMSLQGNGGAEPSHLSASPPPPRVPTRGVAVSPRQRLPRAGCKAGSSRTVSGDAGLMRAALPQRPAFLEKAATAPRGSVSRVSPLRASRSWLALAARVTATPRCPGEGSWGKGREPGFLGSPRALRVRLAARGRCCGSFPCGGHGLRALRGSCPIFLASRLLCRGEARCAGSQPAAAQRRRTLPCEGNKEDSALAGTGRGQARGSPHHHEAAAAKCFPQRRYTRAGPRIELSPASPRLFLPGGNPFFPLGFAVRGRGAGQDPSGGAARR